MINNYFYPLEVGTLQLSDDGFGDLTPTFVKVKDFNGTIDRITSSEVPSSMQLAMERQYVIFSDTALNYDDIVKKDGNLYRIKTDGLKPPSKSKIKVYQYDAIDYKVTL